jgi:hypothetical protein
VEQPAAAPRRRPFGVVLLMLLLLGYAGLSVAIALGAPAVADAGLARVLADAGAIAGFHVGLAAAAALAAVGLWLSHPWGWVAAMLLAGGTLAVELFFYFRGEAALTYMAVAAVIALYLNSADVRALFRAVEQPEAIGSRPQDRVRIRS